MGERVLYTCQKRRNKLATQIMATEVRLRFTCRGFNQAAVDYAGPFTTVQGRGKQRLKRWLCLFTCLTTRAVHLEVIVTPSHFISKDTYYLLTLTGKINYNFDICINIVLPSKVRAKITPKHLRAAKTHPPKENATSLRKIAI